MPRFATQHEPIELDTLYSRASTRMQLEIHVRDCDWEGSGMWKPMPYELSDAILNQWYSGAQKVSFKYYGDEPQQPINRYTIDFDTMLLQKDNVTYNNDIKKVKLVYVVNCCRQRGNKMDLDMLLSLASTRVKLEIHVGCKKDRWWPLPYELSNEILKQWDNGRQQVFFIRCGRYMIDFNTMQQHNIDMQQHNIDCDEIRNVKVVYVVCCSN